MGENLDYYKYMIGLNRKNIKSKQKKRYAFRYKGTKYIVSESLAPMGELKGCRAERNGKIIILIQDDLDKITKQRELHKLITGRRLRRIK